MNTLYLLFCEFKLSSYVYKIGKCLFTLTSCIRIGCYGEFLMLSQLGVIGWFLYMGHSQTIDSEELNTAREKIYIPADRNGGGEHGFKVIADRIKLAPAVYSRSLE